MRNGRRKEFADAYARFGDRVPDPLAESTFRSAVLDWDGPKTEAGRARLVLVRDLLAARRAKIVPLLAGISFVPDRARCDGDVIAVAWTHAAGRALRLWANLSGAPARRPKRSIAGDAIWGGEPPDPLPAWSVFWSLGAG